MVEHGILVQRGNRARRSLPQGRHTCLRYPLGGLREDEVWSNEFAEIKRRDPVVLDNSNVGSILNFAFTEMLNNSIDHSKGQRVDVRWFIANEMIAFEVEDDGVGVFRNVRDRPRTSTTMWMPSANSPRGSRPPRQ